MEVSFASASAPGRRNEDVVLAGSGFVIVLDGVTAPPPHLPTGCVHDPAWFAGRLSVVLADRLGGCPGRALSDGLAEAIDAVRESHADRCDLSNPETPASTVAIVRERGENIDYLVLCDSTVVFVGPDGASVEAVTDRRTDGMRGLTRAEVAARRNVDGGYWVASTDPRAAEQALTGTRPRRALSSLLVCTDGVSRLVDHFGRSWPDVASLAAAEGPTAVIRAVRAAEVSGPPQGIGKQHDDATLARAVIDQPRPGT